jgi:hypothetical protein
MSSFEWMELQTLTNDIELSRSRLVEARKSGDRGRVTALEEEIGRAENRRLQLLAHISTNIVTIPEAASKAKDGAGSRQAQEEVGAEKPTGEPARAPEPAPPARARGGAGSRQAPEPAPPPKAREGAGSRQASAPLAEAAPDEAAAEPAPPPRAREAARAEAVPHEAAAEPSPSVTAGAPEPAPSPKASEAAGSQPASATPAEAPRDGAIGEPPTSETGSAPEPAPPPKAREGAGSRPAFAKADSLEGGTIVWDQLKPSDIERVKNELGTRRAEMLARHAEELKELETEQSQLETLEQAIEMFLRKANRTENAAA